MPLRRKVDGAFSPGGRKPVRAMAFVLSASFVRVILLGIAGVVATLYALWRDSRRETPVYFVPSSAMKAAPAASETGEIPAPELWVEPETK